ncbi:MAG: hypothetical protein JKX92_12810 [Porticoccaceae bacterium]|nr:hypothetical protein [Porticoccaceae bacterium]
MKRKIILTLLFLVSVLLSVIAMPFLILSAITGACLSLYALKQRASKESLLKQSGVVLMLAPALTFIVVSALMSGVLS